MSCYYLAYGSNLHPFRLSQRIAVKRLVATVSLNGFRLYFHKCGKDDSGKCNLMFVPAQETAAFGVVYEIDDSEKPILDQYEGSGYACESLNLILNNQPLECFYYRAKLSYIDDSLIPFDWYKSLVLLGAEYHRFPQSYIDYVTATPSIEDSNQHSRETHYRLVSQLSE